MSGAILASEWPSLQAGTYTVVVTGDSSQGGAQATASINVDESNQVTDATHQY